MSKLCISLPPFAPDYSGAAAALFDMGGMIIIHDASGCTGNYTGYDEPRWYGSDSAVFCSGLRHMDAILGNDEKLIEQIKKGAESLKPKFIAILGSPVPMVIGTDFKGIAKEVEYETGIPTIGIATRGLEYYGKGISDALTELMKKIEPEEKIEAHDGINLLGITPLDFYINGNHEDFIKLFRENGFKLRTAYSMGMKFEDMECSFSAKLNVAISQAGVQVAEYMQQIYDIPYIATTPLGDGEIALEAVRKALTGSYEAYIPDSENAKILIVGEQIIANSIREYLQRKEGCGSISVAVLFDVSDQYLAKGDINIKDETELRKILNSGQYKTVIGDPMLKQLIKKGQKIRFYDLPHVAVSSKVHWDEYKKILSNETAEWLKNIGGKKYEG